MYREEAKKYSPLTIDRVIEVARKNLPAEYAKMPWAHPELNRGAALLQSEDSLNAYLAAYGEAHKRKALKAIDRLPLWEIKGSFEICDWGCGQGLASMCLAQVLEQRKLLDKVCVIHLIEPSISALERASFNIMHFNQSIRTEKINKGLPSSSVPFECLQEISFEQPTIIHLFSNILDIETIDLKKVADIIASSGRRHYVVCMGPARRNEDRINAFCRYFNHEYVNFFHTFKNTQFFRDKHYNDHVFGCFNRVGRSLTTPSLSHHRTSSSHTAVSFKVLPYRLSVQGHETHLPEPDKIHRPGTLPRQR